MKFKQLYWNEKYFEATIAYERLQEAAKNNDNLKFQYAMCLLEIKSYKLAESELHHIVKNENTRYYEEAQYYLALVLIKNQKVKMPKMILDEISNNNLNPSEPNTFMALHGRKTVNGRDPSTVNLPRSTESGLKI